MQRGGLARGRSRVRRLRPASISEAPGRQRLSGPTAAQTDYKGRFYIIKPGPAPSPPYSSLRLLMTNRTWQRGPRINASCDAGEEHQAHLTDSVRQAARTVRWGQIPLKIEGGQYRSGQAGGRLS